MNFQQRTAIAVALCLLIWLIFDWLVPKPELPPEGLDQTEVAATKEDGKPEAPTDEAAPDRDPAAQDERPEEAPEEDGADKVEPVTHTLRSDLLALTVTNRSPARGGLIEQIELLADQFAEHDTATEAFHLDSAPTLAVSFADEATDFKMPRGAYEVREAGSTHIVMAKRSTDVEVTERVEVLDGYEARLVVQVENLTKQPQQHRLHLTVREGKGEESRFDVQRGLCRTDEDLEYEDRSDVEDGPIEYRGAITWGGVDSKYFAQLLAPQQPFAACEIRLSEDARFLLTELTSASRSLEPGETATYTIGLFIGPKELERLQKYAAVEIVPEGDLQEAIDWGFFGGLSEWLGRLLLALLRFFFELTGAWGWAIVCLTVVVKLLTLPLTLKQMASMRAMKRVQPELQKIKEKYSEDRVKQHQEMQALFARAGVNPLAGCLPLLVQMPVWFALYSMLGSASELVHEPFLWLPDLTKQDPYYALPLALGAMMILQNRMMPTAGDETQAKMMRWVMPVVFTGFMLFLPSGLGVYIFVNIVLSVIQTAIQVGRNSDETAEPAKTTKTSKD